MERHYIKHETRGYYKRYHMTHDRPVFSPHKDDAEVYHSLSHALEMCEMYFNDDDQIFIYSEEN